MHRHGVREHAGVSRRAVTRSAVLAAAALLLPGGPGGIGGTGRAVARERDAAAGITLRLPAPTGPYRTGVTTLYLVDRSRPDPWEPGIPVREVMATVFYPARTVHGFPAARQMSAGAAESFGLYGRRIHPELPEAGADWSATTTHSHTGAPAQASRRRPVLLYSPGGGDPRTMGTTLAGELASHGYVVVTLDHPGDAGEVEFPCTMAGREKVRPTVLRDDPRKHPDLFRAMIDTRIADARFVLDRLADLAAGRNPDAAGRPLPEDLGRALDLRRVGVYGHSAGGTTAAGTMYEDRRVGAAVNLEGYLDRAPEAPGRPGELYPVARHGSDRPLLLLGTDGFPGRKELEPSWRAVLARSAGRAHRRRLDGAAHGVFTDYAALAPQLQAAGLMTAAARASLTGPADPARSVPAVRHHVLSFFARHLPAR
ncbi:alpha/beta hydrolase family protein [Streptomyces telluris]|uniref:Alpha/beta hydrolase n=1 Tax=Streptomyces telluris TaxID=2720021 RepID=A0A9X2RLJ1_9ACTN|nr:alpha/beta hydrolase [Streptomyces telluris]MCQ8768376.1 alpha/beta hydrolase [Streptomyces telluris]NJP77359.1 alpha/beta hydrolase [Streptomyces telluris]